MKIYRNFCYTALVVSLFVMGCTSGKNTLEKGNYYDAVLKSVNRLRKSPDNKKAKQTLHNAYPLAQEYHEDLINRMKTSNDQFKWEKVHQQYGLLNRMYDEIQRCPACQRTVRGHRSYINEQNDAGLKAAEVRYALGEQAMATGSRLGARDAVGHFRTVNRFQPRFRDTEQKIAQAMEMAILRVVVDRIPLHSQTLQLSNQFFQDKIDEYLLHTQISDFVRFYTPGQAGNVGGRGVDHVVVLRFDDFVVGQHFVKETVERFSRDSVQIAKPQKGKEAVYGTVSAELRTFRKNVVSSGLLDFQVIDERSNRVLTRDKFPGTFEWFCEWGSFNGDERALTQAQLNICKNRELMPPPPQQLFVEFTKPIYDQVVTRMRNYYSTF